MARKRKKAKQKKPRPGRIGRLQASAEDEFSFAVEEQTAARWNRPRKQRICLRLDIEVLDWFKTQGPGYQTRINQILRQAMRKGRKRA